MSKARTRLVTGLFLISTICSAQESAFRSKSKRLKDYPKELLQQKQWTKIDLRKNSLDRFPTEFSGFEKLEELRLSRNPMTWPDSLAGFPVLRYLDLWDTDVATVPVHVQGFDALETLDLRETYLDEENRAALEKLFPMTEILLSERCSCRPKK